MTLGPEVRKKYTKEILRAVHTSKNPLAIPQIVDTIRAADKDITRDIALALVWHLLSTHKLPFESCRRVTTAHRSRGAKQHTSELAAV